MVSFDAARPGTMVAEWAADARLHDRPPLQLGRADEVVVVAAHPDDETLGAGGLIAHCHASRLPVRIICVTDGAASRFPEARIAETRAAELAEAIPQLAPRASVTMLGFPDGETREHRAEIREALASALHDASPDAVIVAPWRGDGHRDHRIVGEVAVEVAGARRVLEYPIWMWHWARPDHPDVPWERMAVLPIDADTKIRAIGCFASQTGGERPMLRPDFLEHFRRGQEIFLVGDQALGRDYFDAVYARSQDPWRFRTRWYEKRKRQITIAALPHERYQRGLEIGCSIGMLTDLLADRCAHLLAVDISEDAVAQARARVGTRAIVRTQDALTEFPEGEYDVIVLSEVGYYWGAAGLRRVLERIRWSLAPGGVLVACHWRHPVADYPLDGDEVHEMIAGHGWARVAHHVETDFVLDVFSDDARSVAQREGLA